MIQLLIGLPILLIVLGIAAATGHAFRFYVLEERNISMTPPFEVVGSILIGLMVTLVVIIIIVFAFAIGVLIIGE